MRVAIEETMRYEIEVDTSRLSYAAEQARVNEMPLRVSANEVAIQFLAGAPIEGINIIQKEVKRRRGVARRVKKTLGDETA